MFSREGTRKIKGRIGAMMKKYFYLLIKTEGKKRITDKRFLKEIFTSQEDAHKGTVVVHYIGDETLSVPRPHGNPLRQTRISIRPKPSVSTKIEESVKGNSDKPAHKIYKEAVTEGHSVTDKVFTVEIFLFEKCSCLFLLDSPCCLFACSGCKDSPAHDR